MVPPGRRVMRTGTKPIFSAWTFTGRNTRREYRHWFPPLQPVPLGEILIVKVNGEWCVRWVRCYSPDTHIHPSVWSRNFTARVNETGLAGDGINGVRDARRNVSVTVRQYIQGGVCNHSKHRIGG